MDFNKLIARAKAILLTPTTEWPVIANEPATVGEIFKNYVIWLAAISAVAGFVANTIVGYSVPFLGHYRMGFGAGLTGAVTTFVLSLAGVFLVAYLADVLAPTFGGQKNFTQAVKAVAYAYTAAWIAGVGFVVPGLRWLVGIVAADLGGVGYAAYGPRAVSSSRSFDPASPGGKLEQWAQRMEAASQKMQAAQQHGDSTAATQAANALVGAALGGDTTVQALAPERMRALLRASLGGLAGSQVSAERRAPLGIQLSEAEAQYNDDQGHSIKLKIQDVGGASGLVSLATWAAVEEDKQTSTGYEKTYKSGDRMVHEQWNVPAGQNAMGYGEYAVIVGQR